MSVKDIKIFKRIAAMHKNGEKGALATVIETKGSTPGKTGFKMIVTETGQTSGSVGGGCVEIGVIEMAKQVIKDKKFRTFSLALKGKNAACGGWMKIMIEAIE